MVSGIAHPESFEHNREQDEYPVATTHFRNPEH